MLAMQSAMAESRPPPAYRHNGMPVRAADFYAIACDPRRNVAVEACAGAGKTWMLVSRIVRALLADAQVGRVLAPHEILAITFTKRAASEMRERLYQWLREFALAKPERLLQELQDRGVDAAHAQALAVSLAGLYPSLLDSARQVQIRTFHSWFAALLRSAPLSVVQQLGLPLSYELLEDDAVAVALVWRRFYQALGEQEPDRLDFDAVVREHGRAQTEKALAVALDKRVEFALADAAGVVDASVQPFGALFGALQKFSRPADALAATGARERWLERASRLGQESNKAPQKAAQSVRQAFEGTAPSPTAATPWDPAACLAALRKAFFVADEDRLTQHLAKYPAAQQAEAELVDLCAAEHQHAAWLYQHRMARLARVLIAQYAALKRERGWVDMPDVERAALVLLSDPVLSGWVQQRLDARVRHLLIDEFQDTNPLQWQALQSWLSSYVGAGSGAPVVFIVGDPKQSIYRFRRAEPQVFTAAQTFVVDGLQGELLSCDHTRRNATAVVAVVNAAMAEASAAGQYQGFRAHTTASTETGLVCRLPPIARDGVEEVGAAQDSRASAPHDGVGQAQVWRDSLSGPRAVVQDSLHSLEARQAAAWIAQQIADGLRANELMVLSRRRAGLLPLQFELRALQIAAQIGEKTPLIDCCEVQDMVALLDALVSPQHDLSLARALRSPLFGVSDAALVALALRRRSREAGQPTSWFALLQQPWPADHALHQVGATLLRWQRALDALPPHDALQHIYSDGDVLARFAAAAPPEMRSPVLANLHALLATALQMGGGRYATPYAFVRALKAGGVQAPAVVDADAVRLLTVHGAKGLEAKAVLLLDTDTPERATETMSVLVDWPGESAQPRKFVFLASESRPPACAVQTLEFDRAQRRREEINALYVALTRARHSLALSSIDPYREAPQSWWRRLYPLVAEQALAIALKPIDLGVAQSAGAFTLPELPPAPVAAAGLDYRRPQAAGATEATGEDGPSAPADDSLAARIGKAMHRLLEWGQTSPHSALAAAREFGLDAEPAAQARDMAQRILGGQGAWAWDSALLAWQANEVELAVQDRTLRIDRLVQRSDDGHWWVLDFKSAIAPQLQPELRAQLGGYRSAVQSLYPGQCVRAAFLNPQGDLIELDRESPMKNE